MSRPTRRGLSGRFLAAMALLTAFGTSIAQAQTGSAINTFLGIHGDIASASVVRIFCPDTNMAGSGFLHKSGKILTAAHVVRNADPARILVIPPTGGPPTAVTGAIRDYDLDLALLSLAAPLPARTLAIAGEQGQDIPLGTSLAAWGFPEGYGGSRPMITAGYLAGTFEITSPGGIAIPRWLVAMPFRNGNSGGPILRVDDGTVVGVVSARLSPINPEVEKVTQILAKQGAGPQVTYTGNDGKAYSGTETQAIAQILHHLQKQTQSFIGQAIRLDDVRKFLNNNGIAP